jgi:hypothetical protein
MAQTAQKPVQTSAEPTPDKPTLTPEERAQRRQEAATKRLKRDVVRGLDSAQTCIRQASAAINTGDMGNFTRWLASAESAMETAHSLAEALQPVRTEPPTE